MAAPSLARQTWHMLRKEFRLELRSLHALAGILLYSALTVYTVGIGLRIRVADEVWVVLYWVLFLFAAVNALGRSFLIEREGHLLYLYGLMRPAAVILAKLVYNLLVLLGISLFSFGFFVLVVPREALGWGLLLPALAAGAWALSASLTLMSALSARAGAGPALMAVLSLPLVMPQLLLLIRYSQAALLGAFRWPELLGLGLFGLGNILLALLLYPYLWRE